MTVDNYMYIVYFIYSDLPAWPDESTLVTANCDDRTIELNINSDDENFDERTIGVYVDSDEDETM